MSDVAANPALVLSKAGPGGRSFNRRLHLYRYFNNIRVRSFILNGAPTIHLQQSSSFSLKVFSFQKAAAFARFLRLVKSFGLPP
jgi:hypothetical protein